VHTQNTMLQYRLDPASAKKQIQELGATWKRYPRYALTVGPSAGGLNYHLYLLCDDRAGGSIAQVH
jgi:hypothetical protein